MIRLGVNVDHVATLRQARGVRYPDVVDAARLAERGGADGITVHLREDRRHIQDADVEHLRQALHTPLNLEMAASEEMIGIACRVRPHDCCLVPERRQELTTEGGLDVLAHRRAVGEATERLRAAGISVSLFIDPVPAQIAAAAQVGAEAIEIHTGRYADAADDAARGAELERIRRGAAQAAGLGLIVNAGHGLTVENVAPIAAVPELVALNIGHSVVARAIFIGLEAAVRELKAAMQAARRGAGELGR